MNDNTEKLIRELADKLGTTGEHLWGVLLRQVPINAASSALCALAVTAVCLVASVIFWRMIKGMEDDIDRGVVGGFVSLGFLVWWIICGCMCFDAVQQSFTAIYNPEYAALQEIITKIK